MTDDGASLAQRWRGALVAALLAAAVFLVYTPVLNAGFVWDDDDHFTDNPFVSEPEGIIAIWTTAKAIYYPLTLTTWWVLRRLFDLNPLPYHLVTIACHVVACWLLWKVLEERRIGGALVAALLFAVHPMHVESVAWATELKNTQSAVFFFLALLLYGRWEESQRRLHYGAALLAFLAAVLSKPSVTPLPGVLLVLVWWRTGRLAMRDVWATLPFFALSALSAAWTIWEQKHHSNAQGPEWDHTLLERALISARAVWFYVEKMAWPDPLIFIYPRWQVEVGSPSWYVPLVGMALILGALLVACWRSTQRWPRHALTAVLIYLGLLFPVLAFFNIYFQRFSFVADHFAYLATAPVFAALGGGAAAAVKRLDAEVRPWAWGVVGLLLAALGLLSWRQAHAYHDEATLWLDTIAKNPAAWIAHNNLGFEYARQGRYEEAIPYHAEALRLKPNYDEAANNLGVALLQLGRAEEALVPLRRAAGLRENYLQAHVNIGNALAALGRVNEAVGEYKRALEIEPNDPLTHFDLATILARGKRYAEARRHLQEALRLRPDWAEAKERLAVVEQLSGGL